MDEQTQQERIAALEKRVEKLEALLVAYDKRQRLRWDEQQILPQYITHDPGSKSW